MPRERQHIPIAFRTPPASRLWVWACLCLAAGCANQAVQAEPAVHAGKPSASDATLSYNRDIRPILSDKCFACHGPDSGAREADLRLDMPEDGSGFAGARSVIDPDDPDASELLRRVHASDADVVMPPPGFGVPLVEEEKTLLRRWIVEGAPYEGHWAFLSVKPAPVPEVTRSDWPRNAIDRFILARLEAEGIAPSPEAPVTTLVRRVALDLTGLPPSPEAVARAEESVDPDATYEAYVEELLASPRFGERMATVWLDAARYADTNGYLHDNRRSMWPWRDWVIRAYNDNMPYDVFLRDQIAGDLLPDPTSDQRIATGFNRNHALTTESGALAEEYRVEYAADRTNTLGVAMLGVTLECARCHDHKYDPISQDDYFSLFAYFDSLEGENPVESGKKPAYPPVSPDEATGTEVMVMREAAKPRPTFVLDRGQYDAPLKDRPVSRRVPLALGPAPRDTRPDRLGLAEWLISPENPLTARVEVNRIWQTLFGAGLVKTSENFGLQGEWPSHPGLLDALARQFVESGWDRKALIRSIVTSATYRQSSHVRPELVEIDPNNRLLARMSRLRLPAEMIRDQALAAGGLLVQKLGGPGVQPYQPPGLWRDSSNQASNSRIFELGAGDDLYRRSVYTFWKRTVPPPQMALFDAPDRNACSVRRSRTNTPLQALLLMNDEQHLEAARAVAAQALEGSNDDTARLDAVYRRCLGRPATPQQAAILLDGLMNYRALYSDNAAAAEALLAAGKSPRPDTVEAAELAAWTMIANTVLNLDETVTRP